MWLVARKWLWLLSIKSDWGWRSDWEIKDLCRLDVTSWCGVYHVNSTNWVEVQSLVTYSRTIKLRVQITQKNIWMKAYNMTKQTQVSAFDNLFNVTQPRQFGNCGTWYMKSISCDACGNPQVSPIYLQRSLFTHLHCMLGCRWRKWNTTKVWRQDWHCVKHPYCLSLQQQNTWKPTWKTTWWGNVCLMQRTMYSVSDSVSSTGLCDDLNNGPRLASRGTAASCSVNTQNTRQACGNTRPYEPHVYTIFVDNTISVLTMFPLSFTNMHIYSRTLHSPYLRQYDPIKFS